MRLVRRCGGRGYDSRSARCRAPAKCRPSVGRAASAEARRAARTERAGRALSVSAPAGAAGALVALAPKRRSEAVVGRRHAGTSLRLATASLVVAGLVADLGVRRRRPTRRRWWRRELDPRPPEVLRAVRSARVAPADAAAVARQLESRLRLATCTCPASSPAERRHSARRAPVPLHRRPRWPTCCTVTTAGPVSLFVMPGTARPEARVCRGRSRRRIWTRGDTTYVMVGSESEPELRPVAAYFQSARF